MPCAEPRSVLVRARWSARSARSAENAPDSGPNENDCCLGAPNGQESSPEKAWPGRSTFPRQSQPTRKAELVAGAIGCPQSSSAFTERTRMQPRWYSLHRSKTRDPASPNHKSRNSWSGNAPRKPFRIADRWPLSRRCPSPNWPNCSRKRPARGRNYCCCRHRPENPCAHGKAPTTRRWARRNCRWTIVRLPRSADRDLGSTTNARRSAPQHPGSTRRPENGRQETGRRFQCRAGTREAVFPKC